MFDSQVLLTFFRWARTEGYTVDPRILELKRPRVPEQEATVYHIAQVRQILGACNPKLPQEEPAVRILVGAGLRESELCGLAVLIPVRYLFRRQRPVAKKPGPLPIPWERYSFPSSHALRSQCTAVVLALNFPLLWFVAVPLAWLVAWSRVVLRRHYAFDVLIGVVVGFACGLAACLLVRQVMGA